MGSVEIFLCHLFDGLLLFLFRHSQEENAANIQMVMAVYNETAAILEQLNEDSFLLSNANTYAPQSPPTPALTTSHVLAVYGS